MHELCVLNLRASVPFEHFFFYFPSIGSFCEGEHKKHKLLSVPSSIKEGPVALCCTLCPSFLPARVEIKGSIPSVCCSKIGRVSKVYHSNRDADCTGCIQRALHLQELRTPKFEQLQRTINQLLCLPTPT